MSLGNNLYQARKRIGLSQEEVAEKLGVTRQTISKWELDETLPDIRQSKHLAHLYHLTLDELIEFDLEIKEIEEVINNTKDEVINKINWTKVWSKKYPVLASYQDQVNIDYYANEINILLEKLKKEMDYDDLNAMLVLKDILANVWRSKEK